MPLIVIAAHEVECEAIYPERSDTNIGEWT